MSAVLLATGYVADMSLFRRTGVTLEGAEFPLLGETLLPGGIATIGNRVTMSPLLIAVGDGALLVSVDRRDGAAYPEDGADGE